MQVPLAAHAPGCPDAAWRRASHRVEKSARIESVADHGDTLTISGERREEIKEKNHRELHYGSFRRTVPLPPGTKVEDVKASYTDGVLEVRVPLGAPEPPGTKIPVSRAG